MEAKPDPRKRTNAYEKRTIPGYPEKLKLMRIPASRFWWVNMYIPGGPSSGVKKSTKCERFSDAAEFAKEWYEDQLLDQRAQRHKKKESLSAYAEKLKETQRRQIRRGELDERMLAQDAGKLELDILPRIGKTHVSEVDFKLVDDFIEGIRQERNLSASTLKKYVVLMRKVLKEAQKDGLIDHIPSFPTVKSATTPRPWLNPEEYTKLLAACRDLRDNPPPEVSFDWGEMYDFIVFMVHTFLRPSEWKMLTHKHIRTVTDEEGVRQLIISVPNSKTKKSKGNIDSSSTDVAADVYHNRIKARHSGKDDFLFFNDIRDRESYVSDRVSRMFRKLCEHADLAADIHGQKHTMYSLRHSALCFQILKTGGDNLFAIAQNARTSVDMLEKFYLSHLRPEMPEFRKLLRSNQLK